MKAIRKSQDYAFLVFIAFLYTYALSRSMIAATVVWVPPLALWIYCGICVWLFHLVFYNRYTAAAAACLLVAAALFIWLYPRLPEARADWYEGAAALAGELVMFIRGYLPYKRDYMVPFGFGVTLGIALLTAVCIRLRKGFYILVLFGAASFAVQGFMRYGRSDFAVLLFVFCFVAMFLRETRSLACGKNKKEKKETAVSGRDKVLRTILQAGAAVALIANILPRPEPPAAGEGAAEYAREQFTVVDDFLYETFSPKYFPLQGTGFSRGPSRLGGALLLNGRHVMDVFSEERVYLGGAVKDTYTGGSWLSSAEEGENGEALVRRENQWFETGAYPDELGRAQEEAMEKLGRSKKRISVNTARTRTRLLFSPPFSSFIWYPWDEPFRQGGGLSAGSLLPKYAGYTYEYISWDYSDEDFMALMREYSADIPAIQAVALTAAGGGPLPAAESEGAEGLAPYLSLPESLPPRVRELALEVTAGADNGYDRVKALEEYLNGFRYTLEPSSMPEGADFVDYFLFEGGEGYCTYYASALAVMARCAGIPTRYLEGYIMPHAPAEENGGYVVTNQHAHAWAEAYIEGFGWIPFEATPLYAYSFYTGGSPLSSAYAGGSMDYLEYEYYLSLMGYHPDGGASALPDGAAAATAAEGGGSGASLWIMAAFGAAAALFMLYLAARMALSRLRMRKIEAMPNRQAVSAYFALILKTAKAYGYPIRPEETAHAYARRVGLRFAGMDDLAGIFSRASYGKSAVPDGDRARMKACYEELLGRHRSYRMGGAGYIVNRYVLARF